MDEFLDALDKEFGFGSVKEGSFEHTGRLISKDMSTGHITVHMTPFVDQIQPASAFDSSSAQAAQKSQRKAELAHDNAAS